MSLERGHWQRVCACGSEDHYERVANRARLDPLDPTTSRHLPQCVFATTTDPAVLRVLLKVRDGMGGEYWWVECGACEAGWQVPQYAASVG